MNTVPHRARGGRLGSALFAGLLVLGLASALAPARAHAWAAIRCNSDPSRVIRYPGNGMPWPMRVRDNTPEGSLEHEAIENGVSLWNSTVGALDVLSLSDDGYSKCKAPDYAGFGVVGVDDGECSDTLDFDWWGGGANGVRQYWVSNCEIVATTLYANPIDPNSEAELGDIFAHELGHHMNYAHNWYGVSVMGYGVNMYWYLTSEDQGYIRTRYPSGQSAGADPHLHRTVLLTALGKEIKPDLHSQTTAPDPVCSPGDCKSLSAGSQISVMLTYGNGGDAATAEPVRISMFLGDHEIGAWLAGPLPAHSFNTYNFKATVPEGVPSGTYTLTMEVDSLKTVAAVPGPSPARLRQFTGFVVSGAPCTSGSCEPTPAAPPAVLPVVASGGKGDGVVPESELAASGGGDGSLETSAAGCSVGDAGASSSPLWLAGALAVFAVIRRARRRRLH